MHRRELLMMFVGAHLLCGCVTNSYRDNVIKGDTPGRTFTRHSGWQDTQEGIFLGEFTEEGVKYYKYHIVDRYWHEGNATLEILVPTAPHHKARINRVSVAQGDGKPTYFSIGSRENYRMNPADILIEKRLMRRPDPGENYDEPQQHQFPTGYPALVSLHLTEQGDNLSVMIGRQLSPDEFPRPQRSTWSWKYPEKYQWVGTEAIRRNLDQVGWWCEWSEDYPMEGKVFPRNLSLRRAWLSVGYIATVPIDIITFPIMLPFYIFNYLMNWHE